MAAKRFFGDCDPDTDQPNQKRMKIRPSFASVIKEVVMVNFVQNFCSALEPMLRKVVNEEVENGLRRCTRTITRSPSLRIQGPDQSTSTLQLIFSRQLSLPIFTGTKIVDIHNHPLQLILVDTNGDGKVPITLPYAMKIEIVVLDGDFAAGDGEKWRDDEFEKNIVKERTGRRPLLAGDLNLVMRDGYACIGDIEFTDNSSWQRSRKFRVGARVVQETNHGVKIRGAMTESFVVKDHRGELYRKHHPPALGDEVWRLEKIGKGGAFHKKLSSAGIKTVQDFLKLSTVEPSKLRRILGNGMSDKMWEVTLKHAKTCVLGNKFYISRGTNYAIALNPICQVVKAEINGQTYPSRELVSINRAYMENFVRDAYANWGSLEEVDLLVNETALLTKGDLVDQYPNHQQTMTRSYRRNGLLTDGSTEMAPMSINQQVGCSDWIGNGGFICSPVDSGIRYFSESSSEGDLR